MDLDKAARLYCRGLGVLIGAALVAMVALVFGNVVLRYAFNSSITVSEEVSRWLFVWVTFLGAVIAMHERAHLGTDLLLARLSPAGRRLCFVLARVVMLGICGLLLAGSLEQTRINADVLAPSTQLPMAFVYAAGVVFAVSGALLLLLDLTLMRSRPMLQAPAGASDTAA